MESSNLQEKVSGVIRLKVAAWTLAPDKTPFKEVNSSTCRLVCTLWVVLNPMDPVVGLLWCM